MAGARLLLALGRPRVGARVDAGRDGQGPWGRGDGGAVPYAYHLVKTKMDRGRGGAATVAARAAGGADGAARGMRCRILAWCGYWFLPALFRPLGRHPCRPACGLLRQCMLARVQPRRRRG